MSNSKLFKLDRAVKTLIYVVADLIFVNISIVVAIGLWFDGSIVGGRYTNIPPTVWTWYFYIAVVASIATLILYTLFGMYNNLWKYASIDEILKIFITTTIVYLIIYAYDITVLKDKNYLVTPRRLLFIAWMLNTILFGFSRFGYRAVKRIILFASHIMTSKSGCKQVMVIGAGFLGYSVVRSIREEKIRNKYVAIILDDDNDKKNTFILGTRVICGFDRIVEIVEKYNIDEIIISLGEEQKQELQNIIKQCTQTECSLKIVPNTDNMNNFKLKNTKYRDVSVNDLLFREEVVLDIDKIDEYLKNRVVLVTGGGGSIGSELCRQIANFSPGKIIIFDIYENNAFYLRNELKSKYGELIDVIIRIGSVRDFDRVDALFKEFKPSVVFHAAAHKHVSLMEDSPGEAIKNNVFGTLNVVNCADKHKIDKFVLLSTDKAVNPTNIMGASKRITELIIQQKAYKSSTKFMAVRFGNVLGSNGSVIHVFKQQIQEGGPVTVTHPDIERYFMTIPEACQLVLQATSIGGTGSIFVLDMGQPIKINDLAINLIKFSGYRPNIDIKIEYIGLFTGEKLYEELILAEEKENIKLTDYKKIFVTKPIEIDYDKFNAQLLELEYMANCEPYKIEGFLGTMLVNYKKQ